MHSHHIIPRHEWKRRFGNLIGFNASDNKVNLTPEQHSHVHQLLYEANGSEYDRIASLALSGTIGKEDIIQLICSHAALGNRNRRGKSFSMESKEKLIASGTCFSKGHSPWNKNKKGVQVPWNKGTIGKQVGWLKGKKRDKLSCLAQSLRMKGVKRGPYNKK